MRRITRLSCLRSELCALRSPYLKDFWLDFQSPTLPQTQNWTVKTENRKSKAAKLKVNRRGPVSACICALTRPQIFYSPLPGENWQISISSIQSIKLKQQQQQQQHLATKRHAELIIIQNRKTAREKNIKYESREQRAGSAEQTAAKAARKPLSIKLGHTFACGRHHHHHHHHDHQRRRHKAVLSPAADPLLPREWKWNFSLPQADPADPAVPVPTHPPLSAAAKAKKGRERIAGELESKAPYKMRSSHGTL